MTLKPRRFRVRHNLPMPVAGRVNNINYIIHPGEEGTIIEDQILPATQIADDLRNDFNGSAVTKAQFKITEVDENGEPLDNDNEIDMNDTKKFNKIKTPETGFPVGIDETKATIGKAIDPSSVNEEGKPTTNNFVAPSMENQKVTGLMNPERGLVEPRPDTPDLDKPRNDPPKEGESSYEVNDEEDSWPKAELEEAAKKDREREE